MQARMMAKINRSAGVPDQAFAAVARLAQLEKQRVDHLSHGNIPAAGRTLQGMAEVFAKAPAIEELLGAIADAVNAPNGATTSGKAYYEDRLNKGISTYSLTSRTPETLRQYVRDANLSYMIDGRMPTPIAPFVQSGVQAGSEAYYYGTYQSRYVGSGLGAQVPMSTADQAIARKNASDRAMLLKAAATFSGLGISITSDMAKQAAGSKAELCRRFPEAEDCKRAAAAAAEEAKKKAGPNAPDANFFSELAKHANNPFALDVATNAALTAWSWTTPTTEQVNGLYCMLPKELREKNEVQKHFINIQKSAPRSTTLDKACTGKTASNTGTKSKVWVYKPEYASQITQRAVVQDERKAEESNTMLFVGAAAVAVLGILLLKK